MVHNTNTNQMLITRDGEVTHEFDPTLIKRSVSRVEAAIAALGAELRLQARMAVFDALHRTHYRRIRNTLMALERRKRFERSIGLVPVR